MGDVFASLFAVHPVDRAPQRDPLIERGEDALAQLAPQRRLPKSRHANVARESISALVSIRSSSSCSAESRCASSKMSTTVLPRSAVSAANRSVACGISVA